jgi:hypothetical protein
VRTPVTDHPSFLINHLLEASSDATAIESLQFAQKPFPSETSRSSLFQTIALDDSYMFWSWHMRHALLLSSLTKYQLKIDLPRTLRVSSSGLLPGLLAGT